MLIFKTIKETIPNHQATDQIAVEPYYFFISKMFSFNLLMISVLEFNYLKVHLMFSFVSNRINKFIHKTNNIQSSIYKQ